MENKTIFVGVVNGETFDNVAAYNERVKELIEAGVAINASSETKISGKVDSTDSIDSTDSNYTTTTTLDPLDEDLSLYPYMCEDDPFYLNLLVTNDPVTNQEAYNEAQKVLEKCYKYTHDVMEDCCNCERKEYLNDLTNIISDIKSDISDNTRARDIVLAKRVKLTDEFDVALKELDDELTLLDAADKVAGMFKAYYEDVQNEMLTMIKENKCDCKCDEPEVETTVTEKVPQTVADLSSLLKKIFGDNGIYQL
jgi:hypothetical protein